MLLLNKIFLVIFIFTLILIMNIWLRPIHSKENLQIAHKVTKQIQMEKKEN